MPFQMKVQPVDAAGSVRIDPAKPAAKSRLKRLFERQFPSVLRISLAEKPGDGRERERADDVGEMEPSSVCLDKMVLSFMEEGGTERPPRSRCNCFNSNYDDSSDDDLDVRDPPADANEFIKGLILCASTAERNLLADASKIMERAKNCKGRGDCRRIVVEGMQSLGYDAAICKSRWDKNPSFPAGEYEYIDVVVDGGERLIIDVDFRSEFEIARSTKSYRAVLQHLPTLFAGRPDRLQQIVATVSEAGRQSLRKKGLHVPPWRKPDYMRSKWFSPYTRAAATNLKDKAASGGTAGDEGGWPTSASEPTTQPEASVEASVDGDTKAAVAELWQPPPARPRSGVRIVAGLAALL
ncbi:hypothetical protein Cni_G08132 [Canna indica]|uniref:Plant-specific domain TIGR01615 family protein n=1 Tax=Canna indica TaxID=4628 RepID=A0AAQ3Q5G1_9LILI|nr:hypothetical protein Cni_G08132 [Canna indica]